MKRCILMGLFLTLVASSASAQVIDPAFTGRSPRTGALLMRLGSYLPRIDQGEGMTGTPYKDFFGNSGMLLFELEGQRYFYQGYGSAGLSLSAGYAEKWGEGFDVNGQRAGEKSGLQVFPLSLGAFYKMDYAAERWGIPVVPYAEASFRYIPYRFLNTAQSIHGGKMGYGLTGGVEVYLDFIEPTLARNLDTDTGVNHTYLFAEYTRAEVNNFGKGGLDLSSRGWMFGFGVDY
ncbi:hypothetical protein FGE12_21355 [Aggregicoccus sp. 17bor-14]|uniref:MXAN_2562 family outer membrane beta-barrel protein n=1 Tax=Myxococcaceae TaxID=31 RepID=UPI00129CB8E9|nr:MULTISPECIES: MXAN_2562 family outer membrane beta-barrel protein [Myxococcaceae]MBF5044963.1 hypothetical protein [Simulacricoccus sp. 17bor-14]MRI90706.1 hypothetical protein [Aggregicoccus sp. 17bor-14]